MDNDWDVVSQVRWRLSQPKPLLYTPFGIGSAIVWCLFIVLFSAWSILLALRLDGIISLSWTQVWIPVFLILGLFYFMYVFLILLICRRGHFYSLLKRSRPHCWGVSGPIPLCCYGDCVLLFLNAICEIFSLNTKAAQTAAAAFVHPRSLGRFGFLTTSTCWRFHLFPVYLNRTF
jgi:hypothetical protein